MQDQKTVFMFSGQGSQYYQMGQALFEENRVFHASMMRLDLIALQLLGQSVVDILYHKGYSKLDIFDRTRFSHPAIFMLEYAMAETLMEEGIYPDITLGTSMGSFAAAAVAGCISAEDALIAVVAQANSIENYCEKGAMIAILSAPDLYEENILKINSEIASYSFSNHFVVAAKEPGSKEIESFLSDNELSFQRLPVSFPFHSVWIEDAREPYLRHLQTLTRRPSTLPMACCAFSKIISELPSDYFWQIARSPILFQQTILHLEEQGEYRYIDVGPSGTLATFLKYVLPPTSRSKAFASLTPYGRDMENIRILLSAFA